MGEKSFNSKKVFVIGLDGVSFDLIMPWIDNGELPTFKRLMEHSAYGKLKSTIPPNSAPAWTSSVTGKNPGKHGFFDFVERSLDNYNLRLINASDIQVEFIWEMLEKHGMKSIIINLPPIYPPQKIKGIMITGMLSPVGSCISYPKRIQQELENKIKSYKIDIDWRKLYKRDSILEEIWDVTQKRLKASIYLMEKYSWELFMTVFTGTDRIQHLFWSEKDKMLAYFKFIDKAVEELEKRLDKDTLLIIMSDHGFGGARKSLYVNCWLERLSLLRRKRKNDGFSDYASWQFLKQQEEKSVKAKPFKALVKKIFAQVTLFLGITRENIANLLSYFGIDPKSLMSSRLFVLLQETNKAIDWINTKAYLTSSNQMEGININVANREPNGIVYQGADYEYYRQLIIEKLKEWRDPENSDKVIWKIYKKEELYSGSALYKAPDIVFIPNAYDYIVSPLFRRKAIIKNRNITGRHTANGMILIKGAEILKNKELTGAKILDITPTILYFVNLAIPDDLDGAVIDQAFNSAYLKRQKIRYEKQAAIRARRKFDYSQNEEDQIKMRLKGLGYIE
jgi:predicted AlkP superfamily phosphohydrolase/phosphomutase